MPELESIANHITTCVDCDSLLYDLRDGPFSDELSDRLQQCLAQPDLTKEPAFLAMEAAALAFGKLGALTASLTSNTLVRAEVLPKSIGPYTIIAEVGSGGMGIVYRAKHQAMKRIVAIKMIRSGIFAGDQSVKRFRTEAEAVARLRHPNVVELYEFDQHDHMPYFVMEWIEGGSLATKLTNGPLPLREAAEFMRTVATTVAFVHDKQVLHRDLKPGNILIAAEGHPKIADFGLAKLMDDPGNLTNTDTVLGTPSYMAPEQAAGKQKEVGPWTDVYAIGAILYETLTGRPPFESADKLETMRMVRDEPVVAPSRLRQEIPAELEAICVKCLEKRPSRRYASAQMLANDLNSWLQNKPPLGIPSRFTRSTRTLWRHRLTIACGIVVIAFAVFLYLRDPNKPLREIQADLKAGRTATLIGETGPPKWFKFRAGEESSKIAVAKDGTFTIHAADYCLLELLPETNCDNSRFSIQVRHDKSQPTGKVGIYFAHQTYPGAKSDIQFFSALMFNDIRKINDLPYPERILKKVKNTLSIRALFYLKYETNPIAGPIYCPFGADHTASNFEAAGEGKTGWHDLSVQFSAKKIAVEWDNQPFRIDVDEMMDKIARDLVKTGTSSSIDERQLQALQPRFQPRGGLGIFLGLGSASFRTANLTPPFLDPKEQ